MTDPLEIVEQYFQDKNMRYRRADDAIEVSFYGYPVAERYRVVYLEAADAVLISSHGIAYPRPSHQEPVLRTVLTWNHEAIGACWSFDHETRGICADSTLFLGGQPLNPVQFDRHFSGLVNQVRSKLPELLRLIVDEPAPALDPTVKAQLEQILERHNASASPDASDERPPASRDADTPPDPPVGR